MPTSTTDQKIDVQTEADLVKARVVARATAKQLGFSIVDETKLATAVSELARNMLVYAKGGLVIVECLMTPKKGIRITFEDQGPGIKDLKLALQDGYSTGNSLGLGLPGSKRLVSEFNIESEVGKGTKIVILKWK